MAHAATPRRGHGLVFFREMERLLRRGAPVVIETGDAGGVRFYGAVVPRRFPLLRAKMEHLEQRRAAPIEKSARHTHVEQITNEQIVKEFGEPEIAELHCKKAEVVVGLEYGLTDDTGRALNPWARRIIAKGKKVHARARRDHLQGEKIKKYWASPGEQV